MEKYISSTSNPYIKHLKKLQTSAKYRSAQQKFLIEGLRPVRDAYACGAAMETVLVSEAFKGEVPEGNIVRITDKVSEFLSDTKTPQGIMAEVKMPVSDPGLLCPEKSPIVFFCDGVSDPGNLGTIIRTLEAAGVNGIILGRGTVDLYNPKTVRSTMSAILNMPVFYAGDTADAINSLKQKGYRIIGTRLEGAVPFTNVDFLTPSVIIMGNEANGISDEAIKNCDEFIKIPILGKAESLNVAVATAVIAYETVRQRTK